MSRNFMEERQQQLIAEEYERLMDRFFPPEIREIYMRNPLLRILLTAPHRGGKSPFTRPVDKNGAD